MKTSSSESKDHRWLKAPVANLVRRVQSGNHYARICGRGKLIWILDFPLGCFGWLDGFSVLR